jgi:hypothetical protein
VVALCVICEIIYETATIPNYARASHCAFVFGTPP